jgi:hypothetical protein
MNKKILIVVAVVFLAICYCVNRWIKESNTRRNIIRNETAVSVQRLKPKIQTVLETADGLPDSTLKARIVELLNQSVAAPIPFREDNIVVARQGQDSWKCVIKTSLGDEITLAK